DALSREALRARARAARSARQPVLPDREPVPLQRQVLPAVGTAVSGLRRTPRSTADEHRRSLGGGAAVEARAARLTRAAPPPRSHTYCLYAILCEPTTQL